MYDGGCGQYRGEICWCTVWRRFTHLQHLQNYDGGKTSTLIIHPSCSWSTKLIWSSEAASFAWDYQCLMFYDHDQWTNKPASIDAISSTKTKLTFKLNCKQTRRLIVFLALLEEARVMVSVYDPWNSSGTRLFERRLLVCLESNLETWH